MILGSLPCLPLPMLMSKEVSDELSFTGNVTGNSHDLIAHLLNKAAAAQVRSERMHSKRQSLQWAANQILFQRFDEWKNTHPDSESPALDISYGYFAEYTRAYIQSFMSDPSKQLDIRFLEPTDVDTCSTIYHKTQDFVLAQDTIYGKIKGSRPIECMAYGEYVHLSALRILQG
jgi:hypothetical protein